MAHIMKLGFSDLPFIYNLDYPVGLDMPNSCDDVMLVQILMKMSNFTRDSPGHGPVENSRDIKVDGYYGPQTKRMLKAFEQYVRGRRRLIIPDGVVEPSAKDGYTGKGIIFKIIHLNRFAKEASPFGDAYNNLPISAETPAILLRALMKRR